MAALASRRPHSGTRSPSAWDPRRMRTHLLRFVPSRAGRFGLVLALVLTGTTSACTSQPRSSTPPAAPASPRPVAAVSAATAVCTTQRTETLLRALFQDYDAGQDIVGT